MRQNKNEKSKNRKRWAKFVWRKVPYENSAVESRGAAQGKVGKNVCKALEINLFGKAGRLEYGMDGVWKWIRMWHKFLWMSFKKSRDRTLCV